MALKGFIMIIGLSGYKGSGKDTVGKYLVDNYHFERKAFADKIKEATAALFDIDPKVIEFFKNDPKRCVGVFAESGFNMGGWVPNHGVKPITFRHFLQRLGTEVGREVFGKDFWVDQVLPLDYLPYENLVITDVRFENEAKRIYNLDGVVWQINRPGLRPDGHTSENLPTHSLEIWNGADFGHLFAAVDEAMAAR